MMHVSTLKHGSVGCSHFFSESQPVYGVVVVNNACMGIL